VKIDCGDDGLRAPIESEWMITLPWRVCLDFHVSAASTVCSSAKVIGVWFGILHLNFFVFFLNEAGPGCGSIILGTGVGVDVDGWCSAFVQVSNYRSTFFWMGLCMITRMGGSNHGAGVLDFGGVIGGISF